MLPKKTHNYLVEKNFFVKKRFLALYKKANAGHIGSSLSCSEILVFIFFHLMKETDEFVLSKGHAAAALYSVLTEKEIITEKAVNTFYENATYFPAHPPAGKIDKILFATGSLGHGLSIAAGLALSKKFKKSKDIIYCLTSDGELNEGSTWEAAQFITHHNLNNLLWFIDKNNLQGFGTTKKVMPFCFPYFESKGFAFIRKRKGIHNFNALAESTKYHIKKPTAIICNTVKGNGWNGKANTLECHYLPFQENQFEEIMQVIEQEYKLNILL